MKTKKVEQIIAPSEPRFVGDAFRVHNFIPSTREVNMKRMDPFILLDYGSKYYFPPSEQPRGVDSHPHKGFETVTIVYKGKVAHYDNHGGGGVIGEGDVQWMTAGSGLLHKEYHEEEWSLNGGYFHFVQLWVNLPKKDKMSKPKYQSLVNGNIPHYILDNHQGEVEVIAGQYKGTIGVASTFSPMNIFNAKLDKGAVADFAFPEEYNTALIVVEGSILVNGTKKAPTDHFVLMANNGNHFSIEATTTKATVLVLSGQPLNEPIAARGPFVMNTEEELHEAYNDYKNGKFGELP